MSRHLDAVTYVAAAGTAGLLLATAAALPFHGELGALVFIAVALTVASLAGAFTPPAASAYTREDRP